MTIRLIASVEILSYAFSFTLDAIFFASFFVEPLRTIDLINLSALNACSFPFFFLTLKEIFFAIVFARLDTHSKPLNYNGWLKTPCGGIPEWLIRPF